MMARYLIEDNNIEIVKFDDSIKSEVFMINSILKNVLNNYQLYTLEEEESLHGEIKYVTLLHPPTYIILQKFLDKYDIKDNFEQIPSIKKTGRAMPEDIRQVIEEIL